MIRVVATVALVQRLLLELGEIFLGFIGASRQLQRTRKVEQVLGMRRCFVALLQQTHCVRIPLLLNPHLRQIAESIVVSGEGSERLFRQSLSLRKIANR